MISHEWTAAIISCRRWQKKMWYKIWVKNLNGVNDLCPSRLNMCFRRDNREIYYFVLWVQSTGIWLHGLNIFQSHISFMCCEMLTLMTVHTTQHNTTQMLWGVQQTSVIHVYTVVIEGFALLSPWRQTFTFEMYLPATMSACIYSRFQMFKQWHCLWWLTEEQWTHYIQVEVSHKLYTKHEPWISEHCI